MASTFGEPILAPVKQNLADSSGHMAGLRKSDIELLLAGEETQDRPPERGANTTLDAPSMRLEALAAVRTGPDTQHGVANTLGGGRNPARRYAMLAGAALVVALASAGYAFKQSTTPHATAAVQPPAAPPPTATELPPAAAPTAIVREGAEEPKPAAATPVARPTTTATATATVRPPRPVATAGAQESRPPSTDPTASPSARPAGGLVEKPPF
jgi:hypothetical protein